MSEAEEQQVPTEVVGFLVTFSRTLERIGLYPPDHPAVGRLLDHVQRKMEGVLDDRGRLSLGVTPETLVLEETATDPAFPVLRELAGRLHDRELARLTFHPVPEREELAELLAALSHGPETDEDPLGAQPYPGAGWPHLSVEPVPYDRMSLATKEGADDAGEHRGCAGAKELWTKLAHTALNEEAAAETDEELLEASQIAQGLEDCPADEARARTAAARLASMAGALQRQGGETAPEIRGRFVELMQTIEAEVLQRTFEAAPPAMHQRFMEAAAEWMPPETVLELVQEVARDEDLDFSYHVLRVLSKLAAQASGEEGHPEAEKNFRAQVRELLVGWRSELKAPAGGEQARWSVALHRRHTELEAMRDLVAPDRVVRTALELGHLGRAGQEAIDELVQGGDAAALVELLRTTSSAGDTAHEAVWQRMSTPQILRQLLDEDAPDFEAVDELLDRLGEAAAVPMLDTLTETASRPVRRELFSRLTELEGTIEEEILERIQDDRWFVKRNMLALLAERDVQPTGFSPLEYANHPQPAVRREAYRLALRDPGKREDAIRRALQDADSRSAGLAFGSLGELDPESLDGMLPLLVKRLTDEALAPEIRRLGIPALAQVEDRRALETLLSFCRCRTVWRFWTTQLADKSPLMLEALRALLEGWSDHPDARAVLEKARASDDPDVQEAGGGDPTRREAA